MGQNKHMAVTRLFAAMKAFVVYNGKVLVLREASNYADGTQTGKYDVPGGRVELGQRFDESLRREIFEETGLTVSLGQPFHVGEWRPIVRGEEWQIIATFFICETDTDQVILSEDHDDYLWIDPANYAEFNLIGNLEEAFASYLRINSSTGGGQAS